jgi:hypothetical protein
MHPEAAVHTHAARYAHARPMPPPNLALERLAQHGANVRFHRSSRKSACS